MNYKQLLLEESQKSLESTSADSKKRNKSDKGEDDPDEEEQLDVKKLDSIHDQSPSPGNFAKTWSQKKTPKKSLPKKKRWSKLNTHKQPTLESLQELPFMQTTSIIKTQQLLKT